MYPQVYVSSTLPIAARLVYQGTSDSNRALPNQAGAITLLGVRSGDRARVFVDQYALEGSTGARYLYAGDAPLSNGQSVQMITDTWGASLDADYALTGMQLTAMTVTLTSPVSLNSAPVIQMCTPEAAFGCPGDVPWRKPMTGAAGAWTAAFTAATGTELPHYGLLRVAAPGAGEIIRWFQLAGGVGPAHMEADAPLLEAPVMAEAIAPILGQRNRVGLMPAADYAAVTATLPAGVTGIVGVPIDVDVLLPGSPGGPGDHLLPLPVRFTVFYSQAAIDRLGIAESDLILLHYRRAAGVWGAGFNLDALSNGKDWVDPIEPCPTYVGPPPQNQIASTIYFWSVDRSTVGASEGGMVLSTGGPCLSSGAPVPPQLPDDGAAGDIFVQVWDVGNANPLARANLLFMDEGALGLKGMPDPIDELDALVIEGDIESNDDALPEEDVFLSVDPATAAALGLSPADIVVLPAGSGPAGRTTYASAAALGLQAEDDVDALCVMEQDSVFGNGGLSEKMALSLAPGSPSLAGPDEAFGTADDYSPADVFRVGAGDPFPGSGIQVPFLTAAFLSLLPTDNLDALACDIGDPGSAPRTPTPTPTPTYRLRMFIPLITVNWRGIVASSTPTATPPVQVTASATPTPTSTVPVQPTFPPMPSGTP